VRFLAGYAMLGATHRARNAAVLSRAMAGIVRLYITNPNPNGRHTVWVTRSYWMMMMMMRSCFSHIYITGAAGIKGKGTKQAMSVGMIVVVLMNGLSQAMLLVL